MGLVAEKDNRVTAASVESSIDCYMLGAGKDFFTTLDIARFMQVEEYPVRVAVSWLVRYNVIEVIPGVRTKRYTRESGAEYSATVYKRKPIVSKPDFALLTSVFCR